MVLVLAALGVLGPLAQLLGSERLRIGLDEATEAPNVLALQGWVAVGAVGDLVVASEQVWLLVGVAILAARWWRARGAERRELGWPLGSLLLLAVMLALLVMSSLTEAEVAFAVFDPVFLVALALFPVTLLIGISRRTRTLEHELTASRTRLVTAEDQARRRIERDLHDGVQQQLVALLSLTELASRQVHRDPAQAEQTLVDMRTQVRGAIQDLRELVSGIRPPVLEDSGMAAALDSRMDALPAQMAMDTGSVRHLRWSPETEAAAYFVACEAVTNALKHPPGAPVRVLLVGDPEHLLVEVDDRGPGIGTGPHEGRGLAGLRDRVDSLGGAFSVESSPAGGTVVRARFPAGPVPR